MKKTIIPIFLALTCLALAVAVHAEMKYPASFASVVPQYPGSTVEMTMNTPRGMQITLVSQDARDKVVKFYQKALNGQGWAKQMEMERKDWYQCHYRKGKDFLHVMIQGENGQTTIVLMLGSR